MINMQNPNQRYIFDPWSMISPKRRRLLDAGWPGLFREHILPSIPVAEVAKYFDANMGRPTKELYAMLGALILQQAFNLTDEETVQQYAFNMQWHYALNITEESDNAKYICPKTLWSNRDIIVDNDLEDSIFSAGTEKLAQVFKVNIDKQRLDSVHIKSNMRRLGRIGIFSKTIHKFLVNLRRQHPDLFDTVDKQIVEKYLTESAPGCFSMVKPSESGKTLTEVSKDLFELFTQFKRRDVIASMSSFKLLERVLNEHCNLTGNTDNPVEVKKPKEKTLNLITHVHVEQAHQSDANALEPAIESAEANGLKPKEVPADSLYGSDDNCQKAEAHDVVVVAPVMGTVKENQPGLCDFEISGDGRIIACPQGHAPVKVKKKRTDAFALRRLYERTDEFKDRYRRRAGVEATMSEYDLRTGVKRLRVRGLKAVGYCAVLKAPAVNIFRAAAFRIGQMMPEQGLCAA